MIVFLYYKIIEYRHVLKRMRRLPYWKPPHGNVWEWCVEICLDLQNVVKTLFPKFDKFGEGVPQRAFRDERENTER